MASTSVSRWGALTAVLLLVGLGSIDFLVAAMPVAVPLEDARSEDAGIAETVTTDSQLIEAGQGITDAMNGIIGTALESDDYRWFKEAGEDYVENIVDPIIEKQKEIAASHGYSEEECRTEMRRKAREALDVMVSSLMEHGPLLPAGGMGLGVDDEADVIKEMREAPVEDILRYVFRHLISDDRGMKGMQAFVLSGSHATIDADALRDETLAFCDALLQDEPTPGLHKAILTTVLKTIQQSLN